MVSLLVGVAAGIAAFYAVEVVRYCVGVLRWLPRYDRWERATRGQCPTCGYDLTGNVSGRCPECGTEIDRRPAAAARGMAAPNLWAQARPWWVWAMVAACVVVVAVLMTWRGGP
jgi:hypothetical protein